MNDIPPPPDSETLFAQAPGGRPGVRITRYRAAVAIPALVSYYRNRMPESGWREVEELSRGYSSAYEGEMLLFARGPRRCLIALSEGRREPGAMVDVISYAGGTRPEVKR